MALTAGSIEIKLFADLARLQSDMNKANKTVDSAMRNIDKSVSMAKRAFTAFSASFSFMSILKLADDFKRFDSQLQLSTKTLDQYNAAYANVVRISKDAQSEIGAVGVLYSRLTNNLRDFNVTQSQVSDITETVAMSLRASNATVQETSSVMLQLSQSFGSGKLNGQEFLAVAEGAPVLLRQLAKSIGVPFGALKELSAQGRITREELLKAFTDPEFLKGQREAAKQVGTVSSAITVLVNNLKVFVGEQDKASGASNVLRSIIIGLAENINLLATGGLVLIAAKIGQMTAATIASLSAAKARQLALAQEEVMLARKARAEALATIATEASIKATYGAAAAAVTYNKQWTAVGAAQARVAAGAGALRGAMALLGGPIGAITAALTLGVMAWTAWGNSGRVAADQLSGAIQRLNEGLGSINDQKLLQLEKRALEAERRAILNRDSILEFFGGSKKDPFGMGGKTETEAIKQQAALENVERALNDVNSAIKKGTELRKENASVNNEATQAFADLAKANKLLSVEIKEQTDLIAKAKVALDGGTLGLADYNYVVKNANQKIKDLRENKQKLSDIEKQESKAKKELYSDYVELTKAAQDLSKAEIPNYQALQNRLDLLQDLEGPEKARIQYLIDLAKAEYDLAEETKRTNEMMQLTQEYDDADQERLNNVAETYTKILQETEDLNTNIILNDRKRAEAQAEIFHKRRMEEYALNKQYTQAEIELLQEAEMARYEAAKMAVEATKDQKKLGKELQMVFSSAFEDAIVKGENFRDVLKGIEQDIIRLVTRTLVTQPFSDWLSKQVGGMDFDNVLGSAPLGSAGTGSGILGWLSGLLPSFDVGTSYVPNDMVATVHKGERILTAQENKQYSQGGSMGNVVVNNNFTINGSMNSQTQSQIAAQVGMSVNRAMARNT